ncbi:MAG TPA: MgtC/SapB family protein [Candidatus Baltobacteraceae bacterium]|nr:MgtC/SapB family protein [Candidatus Baltobacteraceae bacterium]
MTIAFPELLLRLCVAVALGAAVGLERERVESAAGLRTHALVSLGAALAVITSSFGFHDVVRAPNVVLDPSRIAAQVLSGIGFLGAGVIIFRKEIIRGLTTAASLWVVAAVGLAVGGGLYWAATAATILALAILAVMKPLERRLTAARRRHVITVGFDARVLSLEALNAAIDRRGIVIETLTARLNADPAKSRCDVVVRDAAPSALLALIQRLAGMRGVRDVRSSIALGGARDGRVPWNGTPPESEEAASELGNEAP